MDREKIKKLLTEEKIERREGHFEEVHKRLISNPKAVSGLYCLLEMGCWVCCEVDDEGNEYCWIEWCYA